MSQPFPLILPRDVYVLKKTNVFTFVLLEVMIFHLKWGTIFWLEEESPREWLSLISILMTRTKPNLVVPPCVPFVSSFLQLYLGAFI